jgi:hypothetical protein
MQAHQYFAKMQAQLITSRDSFTRHKIFSDKLFRASKELDELSMSSNEGLCLDELPGGKVLALCFDVLKNYSLGRTEGSLMRSLSMNAP